MMDEYIESVGIKPRRGENETATSRDEEWMTLSAHDHTCKKRTYERKITERS